MSEENVSHAISDKETTSHKTCESDSKITEHHDPVESDPPHAADASDLTSTNTSEQHDASEVNKDEEQSAESSQNLDALDEQPESKRRATIILTVTGILAVFAIAILFIMPPLGWSPQKGVKSDYHQVSSAEIISAGATPSISLNYTAIKEPVVYAAEITQTTNYSDNKFSRFKMRTELHISHPARHQYDDEIAIKLQNVDVHIFDGEDKEIPLASSGKQLEGIFMFSRLTPHEGMYSIVPDASINPQVARILFSMSDALRQIWLPLPNEPISSGASWRVTDIGDNDMTLRRILTITLNDAGENSGEINSSIALESVRGTDWRPIGNGKSAISLKSGRVEKAEIHYERTSSAFETGSENQTTDIRIERIASEK